MSMTIGHCELNYQTEKGVYIYVAFIIYGS